MNIIIYLSSVWQTCH